MGMVGTAAEELALFQKLKAGGRFAGHDRGRLRRRRSDLIVSELSKPTHINGHAERAKEKT
jgi:hypothetical protein